ncbi:MAG: hypothetical protein Q8O41_06955 [Candidatus Methanoperedens sp.]|nr:hypothetical protein [Candidatus Methanoperedens sp.]
MGKKLTVRHSSFNQPALGFAQTRGSAALQAESQPDMDNMDLYNENTNYNINVANFIK